MALRYWLLTVLLGWILLAADGPKKAEPESRLLSIFPLAIVPGSTVKATLRGTGLEGARSVQFIGHGLSAVVRGAEGEALLHLDITVAPDAAAGEYPFRAVTENGLTNQMNLRVADTPVSAEADVEASLPAFPVTVNGRIANRGENDSYWIDVDAGQTLTFEATSGYPAFDPSISLYEPSGSWFDSKRLNRIAFNDEPLHFPGLSSSPRLVHTFPKAGRYCVRLGAFSGQGGPDYIYALRVTTGATPEPDLHPKAKSSWDERQFIRPVSNDWMQQIAARGGMSAALPAPELFSAIAADAANLPVMSVPGIVQGRFTKSSEVHAIRLKVDKPQDLAFEIETPEATMPRFNPVIRVLEPGGAEIVTNVQTKLNNNGLYMMKMIQAKTTVSLRNPGEYLLQIRDITTDCSGDDFAYRVLVRPQTPHLGRVTVTEDALSIRAGVTKPIHLTIEREEDFNAPVAFAIEGLPPGLSAVAGISPVEEKPLLFNGGKMERYTPKTQKSVLLVTAAENMPAMTEPVSVRIVARPFVGGAVGDPILVKEVSLLVLPRSSS